MRYLVWLLLLASLAMADITVVDSQYYSQDAPLKIHFLVDTAGVAQTNATESCNYSVYFNNGTQTSHGMAKYATNWYFELNPEPLTTYNYLIWCSSAVKAGTIRTTPDGDDKSAGLIWLIAFLPLIFSGLLVIGTMMLDEQHNILKVVAFFFTFIGLWLSYQYSALILTNYYGFDSLQEALGDTTFYLGITFFALMSYFIIYAIYVMVKQAAQDKEERLRY